MTPFQKPVAEVTKQTILDLVARQDPEGRFLEYKREFPSRENEGRSPEHISSSSLVGAVRGTGSLSDHGKEKLLKEIVAFANGDGGVLIIGIDETGTNPPRAGSLLPIPQVLSWEDKFRNIVLSGIEPRLPYCGVKAIITEDDGAGVLLIEAEPSRLGPHWVRSSREVTIRREDRCVNLSMPEIHEMVIRNARRFDDLKNRMKEFSTEFHAQVREFRLRNGLPEVAAGFYVNSDEIWEAQKGGTTFSMRITVIPHHDIGLSRLESFVGIVPPANCIRPTNLAAGAQFPAVDSVWLNNGTTSRFLGGVMHRETFGEEEHFYRAFRDGTVEFCCSVIRRHATGDYIPIEWLAAAGACTLGIFDRLRRRASVPFIPAEVGIEICTRGNVTSGFGRRPSLGAKLRTSVLFPTRTIADTENFSEFLNESAADLRNEAGMTSDQMPKFEYLDI